VWPVVTTRIAPSRWPVLLLLPTLLLLLLLPLLLRLLLLLLLLPLLLPLLQLLVVGLAKEALAVQPLARDRVVPG
jgi:hypothetical protein